MVFTNRRVVVAVKINQLFILHTNIQKELNEGTDKVIIV